MPALFRVTRFLLLLTLLPTGRLAAQERTFTDGDNRWRVQAYAPNVFKVSLTPRHYARNEEVTGAVVATPRPLPVPALWKDGELELGSTALKLRIAALPEAEGYRGFRFRLQEQEKIYGGGERALPLNRRGYRLPLYNNPWYGYGMGADALNFSVPFFTSSAGYALFFDNGSRGYADLGRKDPKILEAGFISGALQVYVIFGRDHQEILSSYYRLTGTQPLPPRWALGNYMSRFGYTSEAQTRSIAAQMRAAGIPFDAVIFDLFWFGDSIKGTMGNLDWVNREKWPDPRRMMQQLISEDVQPVLIAEPFLLRGTRQYAASVPYLAKDSAGAPYTLTDFYFGQGGLLDIFRRDAGNWIWNTHYRRQIANGVHAWWTDLGEPEKHPASLLHNLKDQGVQRPVGAEEVHNLYGHYWNKMLAEKYAQHYPQRRLFHLNRSGFAGSQRYSIFPWSGDVSRSWDGFRAQLPLMLGMSMSGVPYIHADAGGFAGGEGDHELYVRWLQYAAFTPIFRPHGTALFGVDPNTFNYPSEPALIDTPFRHDAREAVYQRYRLLPYHYTLSYRHTALREPLAAPLYYYFNGDTIAENIQDQYMWGRNLMVCPVTEKAQAQRRVYLPAGTWYDWYRGTPQAGHRWISRSTPLQEIPVYVKAGSFVPLYLPEDMARASAARYDGSALTVLYYPGEQASEWELYDDDGISRRPAGERIRFSGSQKGNRIEIRIRTDRPQHYRNQTRLIRMAPLTGGRQIRSLTLNGKPLPAVTEQSFSWSSTASFSAPAVPLRFEGKALTLVLELSE